ncbi:ComEC/Rec2 family competence protein [Paenibacillus agricola]|uniref:MBL fold metallo-hydrolase n=1 Tax=Paenibacillus agricola TaxID=2716264 RepID=A0ABX0J683_9BACL|nr:ComEC/Rec2 family competence protein [Paenibacillus agricola]NHN30343.1 MBL fold metallo-hydrolase [Paenibacillus agricola]
MLKTSYRWLMGIIGLALVILVGYVWLVTVDETETTSGVATVSETEATNTNLQPDGKLRVIFLDVGQGGSQLLISPSGKTMLIDAGNNDKEQVMVDYLKKYHIERLDLIVGTHPDADHIGGLDKVIDYASVGKIYMPKVSSTTKTFESVLESVKNKSLQVQTAKAGLSLEWDKSVKLEMIAPVETYGDPNNMSAVIKVTFGSTSFLLTGDAEAASEKDMLKSGVDLSATVLGVGHHGSKSSTSLAFLKQVNPKYAVIQSGKDNNYGHPEKTILSRLTKAGAEVFRNDLQGTVTLVSDGNQVSVATERKAK